MLGLNTLSHKNLFVARLDPPVGGASERWRRKLDQSECTLEGDIGTPFLVWGLQNSAPHYDALPLHRPKLIGPTGDELE